VPQVIVFEREIQIDSSSIALGTAKVYIRDKEKREVDFAITGSRVPQVLIEARHTDTEPSESLVYFQQRTGGIPALQLVRDSGVDRRSILAKRRVVTASRWLAGLP
jgi:hypothetical protein